MDSQDHHFVPKKKLTMQKEEAVDPLFHLFTEIPLTCLERDPDFFSKNFKDNKKVYHPPSQRSNRSLHNSSSAESFRRLDYPLKRASLNEAEEQNSGICFKQKSDTMKQLRIKNICRNFTRKLKRNNVYSKPLTQQEVALNSQSKRRGFTASQKLKFWWGMFASILMVSLFISQSLVLAFPELEGNRLITVIIALGIVLMVGEMGFGFVSVKHDEGREIEGLFEIMKIYSKRHLPLDALLLILLVLMLARSQLVYNQIFVAIFMAKLLTLPSKLRIIERTITRYSNMQSIWPIIKIILLNLCIAHAIAILLNLMATANPGENWQIAKGIIDVWWFQRYIWSYYWSVAIMTTVGFGGIAPASYCEAMWIIIIQILCCLVFAYNLSCIGSFIANRDKSNEARSVNAFEDFAERKGISEMLKKKVMNYIVDKDEIKAGFHVQEQNAVIESLPHEFQKQVQQQSIKNSMNSLPFFSQLHFRTLYSLSQCLERNVYLPNQTVKPFDDEFNIYLLEKGEMGFACRAPLSKLHNLVVNSVKIGKKQMPFLLSLDFITQERSKLQIKSMACSIVLKLPFDDFKRHISSFPQSHQFYCFLRDRSKHTIDEFQTVPCDCGSKHTKLSCPKLHFMPIRQLVIAKRLNATGQRTSPFDLSRIMRRKMNSLNISKYCQDEYSKITSPALHRYEERRGTVLTARQQNSSLIDVVKSHSLWTITQPSLGETDWASFLSLQLGSGERAEDEVWQVGSDKIQDYCGYFPQGNLASIARKRSLASLFRRGK